MCAVCRWAICQQGVRDLFGVTVGGGQGVGETGDRHVHGLVWLLDQSVGVGNHDVAGRERDLAGFGRGSGVEIGMHS